MKKSELKQLIREEVSKVLNEGGPFDTLGSAYGAFQTPKPKKIDKESEEAKKAIINDFKKDAEEAGIMYASIINGDKGYIKILLDDEPNKEKNIINKVFRNKYDDKLVKVPSEADVMIFKIK
jgi:hypothetical protein